MMNYIDPSLEFIEADLRFLYRTIEAFVRGSVSIGATRSRPTAVKHDAEEGLRSHLMEGGYIMNPERIFKLECKMEHKMEEEKRVDP